MRKINISKSKDIKSSYFKNINEKNKYSQKLNNCEVCGKKNFITFQAVGRIGKPLEYGKLNVVICKSCSHKFTNPRYEDSFYKKYYKSNYRKIAFGDLEPSNEYQKFQILRGKSVCNYFTKKILQKKGTILDHGCASGLTMLPWIKKKWNAIGIDPHRPSVRLGKRKYKLNIKNAFGEKLPFNDNKFDLILSLGSLEHSYDLKKTLNEIKRTLRNNGHLIIRWRSNNLIGSPLEYYNHNHYRFFTKKTWDILLKYYGFSSIKHINKSIEGYKSYLYIIAKNSNEKNKNIKNNKYYLSEINKHKNYLKKYYHKCLKIEKLMNSKKMSNKNQLSFLKKNKINLLNIGKVKARNRFFSEAVSFLSFLRRHKYI